MDKPPGDYGAVVVINEVVEGPAGPACAAGTALLLAAAPAGRSRVVDATSVLHALAAVPPSALTGTEAATVIELADPLDPQTVLARLRAAAASPGPLSLYIAGQLHLDRRQRLPHLALARTAPATLRYSALPWHWLAGELKLRRPGTTRAVVDLVADDEVWRQLTEHSTLISLGHGTSLYGRVAPPPARRTVAAPVYLKACAAIWRSGARPPLPVLHEQAMIRAGTDDDALFLAADAPTPPQAAPGQAAPPQAAPRSAETRAAASGTVPAPGAAPTPAAPVAPAAPVTSPAPPAPVPDPPLDTDPHPAILAAARAGRHDEAAGAAAAWEQHALRTYGPGSPQAIHWLEVRADLARLAHDPYRSCELWLAAARARLDAGLPPTDADVEAAVDRAHHQWEHLQNADADADAARALAPALLALRRRVPGRRPGALESLLRRTN